MYRRCLGSKPKTLKEQLQSTNTAHRFSFTGESVYASVFDMAICFSRYHGVNLVQLNGAKLHDGSFSRFRFGLVPVRKENPRRNNKKTDKPPLPTRRLNAKQQIRSDKSSIKQPSKERAKRASEISAKRF